jgi:ribulose-5-phosphate 4-epimerase/fuculose-1-phosphate aldolase
LIRGHGNVVVRPNVKRATIRTVYTEVNARLQTIALGRGGPINYISPEEGTLRDKNPGEEGCAWDGWKDKVMRR